MEKTSTKESERIKEWDGRSHRSFAVKRIKENGKTYFDLSMIGFCFWPLAYASKMNSCGRPPVVMGANRQRGTRE